MNGSSGGGSYENFKNLSGSGSGSFNGFLSAQEEIDGTPVLLKQGILKTLKGNKRQFNSSYCFLICFARSDEVGSRIAP